MPAQEITLERICEGYESDVDRLAHDVQNTYSASKISFIYERLKNLGPWKSRDFTMELIFEIDMMQAAFAVEYSRIFDGPRKVSRAKVPAHLKGTHDAIIGLRNKRYAHDDKHATVENFVELEVEDRRVLLKTGAEMDMVLGAPAEWEALIKWLGEHLYEQTEKQLKRLSDKTGYEWVQQEAPSK